MGFIYSSFNRRVRRPFNGSVYEYLGLSFLLFKYFNMQCLKSSIWNGETSLHVAYKVTLIASLNREGFGSAIIPVGQIGHLAPRIDLPSFGQYSMGVDVVTRLKCMCGENDDGNRNYALGVGRIVMKFLGNEIGLRKSKLIGFYGEGKFYRLARIQLVHHEGPQSIVESFYFYFIFIFDCRGTFG